MNQDWKQVLDQNESKFAPFFLLREEKKREKKRVTMEKKARSHGGTSWLFASTWEMTIAWTEA